MPKHKYYDRKESPLPPLDTIKGLEAAKKRGDRRWLVLTDDELALAETKASTRAEIVRQLYDPGRFHQICYDFYKIMPKDAAVLLGELQGKERMTKAWERNDGWFYARMEDLCEFLTITVWEHTRLFNDLKRHNIIETRRTLNPPQRLIRIKWEYVDALIAFAKMPKGPTVV